MHGLKRKAAGMTAATLLVVASSMLVFPASASASAETKTVPCGSEVKAEPGDHIRATDPLLGVVPLDLGVVTKDTNVLTGTINALLGTVCKVTVQVIDKVVRPIPGVGEPAADALKKGTSGATGAARDTVNKLDSALSPSAQQPPQQPPRQPGPGNTDGANPPGNSAANRSGNASGSAAGIPRPDTRILGSGVPLSAAFLPQSFSSGYAPMRDYSNIPMAQAGLYAPSPGIRYGQQIPGYAPDFNVLGRNGSTGGDDAAREQITKAGGAKALPGSPGSGGNPASLPVLLAVIALAGSTAALVRTWVLRKA